MQIGGLPYHDHNHHCGKSRELMKKFSIPELKRECQSLQAPLTTACAIMFAGDTLVKNSGVFATDQDIIIAPVIHFFLLVGYDT